MDERRVSYPFLADLVVGRLALGHIRGETVLVTTIVDSACAILSVDHHKVHETLNELVAADVIHVTGAEYGQPSYALTVDQEAAGQPEPVETPEWAVQAGEIARKFIADEDGRPTMRALLDAVHVLQIVG